MATPRGVEREEWLNQPRAFSLLVCGVSWLASAAPCPTLTELGGSARGMGVSASSSSIRCQRVALDREGRPYALWADDDQGSWRAYLRAWDVDAGRWLGIDGSDADAGLSRGTVGTCFGHLAFTASNVPHVVWSNTSAAQQSIYLARLDGAGWRGLGGSNAGSGLSGAQVSAFWPDVTIGRDDTISATWTSSGQVYAVEWNGSTWVPLGPAVGLAGAGAQATLHDTTSGQSGDLFVVWSDNRSTPEHIRLRRWNSVAWSGLGGSDDDGGLGPGSVPRVATGPLGAPNVTWEGLLADGGSEVRVARWSGSVWEHLARPAESAGRPTIAIDSDGTTFVGYEARSGSQTRIKLARLEGSSWQDCPLGKVDSGSSSWPEIATSGTALALTWFEEVAPARLQQFALVSSPVADAGQDAGLDGGLDVPSPSDSQVGRFSVGCDCSQVSSASVAAFVIALASRRRRRDR